MDNRLWKIDDLLAATGLDIDSLSDKVWSVATASILPAEVEFELMNNNHPDSREARGTSIPNALKPLLITGVLNTNYANYRT